MANITLSLAPVITSGSVSAYPLANWPSTVDPAGAPVGASAATATVGANGTVTFTGLNENTDYVAYQASPDRYVRFRVDTPPGSPNDPLSVQFGTGVTVDVSDRAARALGVADVSDRAGRLLGQVDTTAEAGWSRYRLLSAATTNAQNVKAAAGKVGGWYLFNAAAATRYVKLYNLAGAPVVGTDVPAMTIPLPAGAAANIEFKRGIAFATGIALAITAAVADNDATAVAANDVIVNLLYA